MFCAIIRIEEISLKSVRSGRLLKRDRADFIFYSRKPTTSSPAARIPVGVISAGELMIVPQVQVGDPAINTIVSILES